MPKDKPYIRKLKTLALSLVYYFSLVLIEMVYSLAILPGILLIAYYCYVQGSFVNCLWAIPVGAAAYIVLLCSGIFVIKRFILGNAKPGFYHLNSLKYLRIWLIDRLNALSLASMESLCATIYNAPWLRLLGAKIGKRTEVSTMGFSFPDLITLGEENFIADSTILSAARVYQGYMMLGPVSHGKRVFIGNGALVPLGTKIGDNCLIGCLSVPPVNRVVAPNTSWFGAPAVLLPQRQTVNGFSDQQTYTPSTRLRIARGVIEFFKITLPPMFYFLIIALEFISIVFLGSYFSLITTLLLFPCFAFTILLSVTGMIIGLKWLLIGRYREKVKPMWSPYVWLSELISGLYDTVMVPFLLSALLGTPFMAIFLRLLGAKVGKRVYIGTPYFSEFDLIDMGDNVALNTDCTIQTHLFEDRIMKMANIKIENGCNVGDRAIVLYGTIMQPHSTLGSLSLLMKGEVLNAYSRWEGVPAQHIAATPE